MHDVSAQEGTFMMVYSTYMRALWKIYCSRSLV